MKTLNNFNTTLLHSINFKTLFSFIALVCYTHIGFGQTTTIDFETENSGYTPSATEGSTFTVVFNRIDRTGTALGGNNTFLFAIENLNNVSNPSITLDQIDVTGSNSFTFSIDMLAHHFNDWDNSDELLITYSVDGASYQNLMWVQNTGQQYNDPAALDLDFDGDGECGVTTTLPSLTTGTGNDCTVSNNTFATFITNSINLFSNTTLDIKLQFNGFTSGDEGMYFDNIIIEQTGGSTDPTPGISLGTVSGNTNESGTTATFTTVLDVVPASDVVLDVSSDYPGEVSFDLSQLTFTDQNWDTPQTITITGLDDSDEDGDIDVTITVAVDDALSDAAYAGLSETTTVTNEDDDFPNILITEFMYNTPGTDDEWIELYNNNGSDVDISTWTLNVGPNTFTFPPSTNFPNNTYITIAMGSNGDGTYNNDNPFTPNYSNVADPLESTNDTNNMSNGAATITLENIASSIIDTVVYDDGDVSSTDGSGPSYEIIDTTADNSSTASNWQASIFNGGTPGNTEISWTGTTSSDWATTTNWSTGAVPTSSDIVFINGTFTNEPSIVTSTDAAANSLFVATGNTLTIDKTSSLTVAGDFTNTGSVTLNSTADDFSSLIVEGTASGDILYNRFVNVYDDTLGGGWDFVGAPAGMTIADFITANGANIQVLGDDYAFAQYDNATGQYTRYATASQTGSFTPAQGYALAMSPEDLPPPPSGGVPGTTVAFTGAMETTSQSINIVNNHDGAGGRRWNLVSNPFPSYISGNTAAGVTNFIDANSTVIDNERLAVYGWNGSDYDIYNQLSGGFSIAPGQGFWVAAAGTSDAALDFTAAMRTTTGTGDFVSGPQLLTYNLGLKLYNGEIERAATNFYFRDGLTLGLDPGYDAAAYNQSTKLSSRLTGGSQETAFAINAMDIDDLQNTRVPLEIRQNAGQAFTISISDMELPQDISVYLEDTLNGTLTSLKDGDFALTAQSNLSGSR